MRTLPVIDREEYEQAETLDFDVTKMGSCLYYLCEMSFGFTTTHPDYTEEKWLVPIQAAVREFHGETAYTVLRALVYMVGIQGYEGEFPPGYETPLMQAAMVASEYHRGVRQVEHIELPPMPLTTKG